MTGGWYTCEPYGRIDVRYRGRPRTSRVRRAVYILAVRRATFTSAKTLLGTRKYDPPAGPNVPDATRPDRLDGRHFVSATGSTRRPPDRRTGSFRSRVANELVPDGCLRDARARSTVLFGRRRCQKRQFQRVLCSRKSNWYKVCRRWRVWENRFGRLAGMRVKRQWAVSTGNACRRDKDRKTVGSWARKKGNKRPRISSTTFIYYIRL